MIPISEFRKAQAEELQEYIDYILNWLDDGMEEIHYIQIMYLISLYDKELVEYILSIKPWKYEFILSKEVDSGDNNNGFYYIVLKKIYNSDKDWEEWRVQVFRRGSDRLVEAHSDIDIHLCIRWILDKLKFEEDKSRWVVDEPEDLPF